MKQFDLSFLLAADAPWAFLAAVQEREIDMAAPLVQDNLGVVTRIMRGSRCITPRALFGEWAAALQFPYYFGENWDAFDECITDLEWLPGTSYVFFVTHVDRVLADADQEFDVFIDVLCNAAKEWETAREGEWERPAIPFRVIFQCEPHQHAAARHRLDRAGAHAHPLSDLP